MMGSAAADRAIVVIGAGGHGRMILDCLDGRDIAGILDAGLAPGTMIGKVAVIGDDRRLDDPGFINTHAFIVGLGDNALRQRIARKISEAGGVFAQAVHRSAIIGSRVVIGAGTVMGAGAIVNCDSIIGSHAIVNTGAQIDHDCHIGDGCHICPGTVIAGTVRIGSWSMLGAGTTVINNISIGENTVIGAGAVVVRDIPAGARAYGNPARPRDAAAP